MITDSSKLQKIIDELGYLLMQGNYARMNSQTEYLFQKTNPVFDIDSFVQKWEKDFNTFINLKILTKLQELLGHDHYYLFHFLNPEVSLISRSDWNIRYNNLYNGFGAYLKALEDIIFRLEDQLSLAIKREIAQQEVDQNVLYRVTYSEHTRQIKMNGIELAQPDFESENERFFSYMYARPNVVVKIEDFEKEFKVQLKKRPVQILYDLGFTGSIKDVFFPICTVSEVKFVNPITNKYALDNELSAIKLGSLSGRVRKSQKESE